VNDSTSHPARMRKMLVSALVAAVVVISGCQTLKNQTRADDTGCLGGSSENNTPKTVAMVAGGVVAAAGPAVLIGGIVLDQTPATPPVEAYLAGAGLTTVGVATILVAYAVL
jgi:hypothetical protein